MRISISQQLELYHLIERINSLDYYAFLCFKDNQTCSFVINDKAKLAKITFLESQKISKVRNYIKQLHQILAQSNL